MYQFFVEPDQIKENTVYIKGSDVNHIKNVLRMKIGEELNVSNGIDKNEYRCAISSFEDDVVVCELLFIKEDDHELPSKIYLFQGLPKADKMESIIQKNVELGVFEIIPVDMKRCVVKLDNKKAANKVSRWQEIAKAAAKQSKRGIIPIVNNPYSFKEAVNYAKDKCNVCLMPYEMAEDMSYTRQIIGKINKGDNIAIFIGPEGGIAPEEVEYAVENGFNKITLGKRILRTETAGMTVMSILMYLLEQ